MKYALDFTPYQYKELGIRQTTAFLIWRRLNGRVKFRNEDDLNWAVENEARKQREEQSDTYRQIVVLRNINREITAS